MAKGLDVKITGVDELVKFFSPSNQTQIFKNVTNKIATDAKSETVKNIKNNYNLSPREIGPRLKIQRATPYKLTAKIIDVKNRRLSFLDFKRTKQTKDGVSAEIQKGKRKTYPRSFIRTPTGRNWMHKGQSTPSPSKKKLPFQRISHSAYKLIALKAMTLWQMVGGDWNLKIINAMIKKNGKKYTEVEVAKALRRLVK